MNYGIYARRKFLTFLHGKSRRGSLRWVETISKVEFERARTGASWEIEARKLTVAGEKYVDGI